MSDTVPSNLRQAHWGIVSQAVNTGTNFLLSILVARTVSAAEFGAFASAMVIYLLGVNVLRSSGNDALSILYTNDSEGLQARAREVLTYALGLGVLLIGPCFALGIVTGGSPLLYAVLALSLPILLVQESMRGLAFVQGRPRTAASSDLLWAGTQILVTGGMFLVAHGETSMLGPLVGWVAGGVVAGVVAVVRARLLPAWQWPHRWFLTNRRIAAPMLASYMLTYLPANLTYLLMPAVTDISELGVLRAAYLFFGPLGVLILCLRSMILPDAARIGSARAVRRLLSRVAIVLGAVAMIWSAAIILLPDELGFLILGHSWDHTFEPRLFLGISLVAEAVTVGAVAALGMFHLMSKIVRVQVVMAPLTIAMVLVLAHLYGATGAAAGFAVCYWLSAGLAWLQVPARSRLDDGPLTPPSLSPSKKVPPQ